MHRHVKCPAIAGYSFLGHRYGFDLRAPIAVERVEKVHDRNGAIAAGIIQDRGQVSPILGAQRWTLAAGARGLGFQVNGSYAGSGSDNPWAQAA